jgi:hypothetical protein
MLLGIDHLVIAVSDPDDAVHRLAERLGLAAGGGGRHGGLGTFNRVLWLGDTFIELIGVFDRGLAAASWIGAPTVRALDAGGGPATWALATDDIATDVRGLQVAGSNLADPILGQRERPDGQVVRWRLAAPPHLGPADPPFLIEHDLTAAEWTQADRAARAAAPGRLLGIELAVPDARAAGARLERTVGIHLRPVRTPSMLEGTIGEQFVRLAEADRVPRTRIAVATGKAAEITFDLLGCSWIVGT